MTCPTDCGIKGVRCPAECIPECSPYSMEGIVELPIQPQAQAELDQLVMDANICRIQLESKTTSKWPTFFSFRPSSDILDDPIHLPDEGSPPSDPFADEPPPKDGFDWGKLGLWAGGAILSIPAIYGLFRAGAAVLDRILPNGKQQQINDILDLDARPDDPSIPPRPNEVINDGDLRKYKLLTDVTDLRQGDILVYQEYLTINFEDDSRASKIFTEAKKIGKKGYWWRRSNLKIATAIANLIENEYAEGQGRSVVQENINQTVGLFFAQGGCCRHRSALLQMALQLAGVKSRYVDKGYLKTASPFSGHAWVEVDIKGDGSYSYVIDLNAHNRGKIKNRQTVNEHKASVRYEVNGVKYFIKPNFNSVLRPMDRLSALVSRLSPSNEAKLAAMRIKIADDTDEYRRLIRDAIRRARGDSSTGQPQTSVNGGSEQSNLIDQLTNSDALLWLELTSSESFRNLHPATQAELNSPAARGETIIALKTLMEDPSFRLDHMDGDTIKPSGYEFFVRQSATSTGAYTATRGNTGRRRTRSEETRRDTRADSRGNSADAADKAEERKLEHRKGRR